MRVAPVCVAVPAAVPVPAPPATGGSMPTSTAALRTLTGSGQPLALQALANLATPHACGTAPAQMPAAADNHIPCNAHWVWMGTPLPADVASNINRFSAAHPDYRATLWVSRHVWSAGHGQALQGLHKGVQVRPIEAALDGLEVRLVAAFERERSGALHNYAAASDIARVAVLYQYGGVYMDGDARINPAQPLGQLTAAAGVLRLERGNAVLAAAPGNRFVATVLQRIALGYTPDRHAPTAQAARIEATWGSKRAYNSRDAYLALDAERSSLLKIKNPSVAIDDRIDALVDQMDALRDHDLDRGRGDPAVLKTTPRLAGTMQATGPDLWAAVLATVPDHAFPEGHFEPIDASAQSYTRRPPLLRRDSL